jgi:hypothetical protein
VRTTLKPLFLAALFCAAASSQAAITVYTSQSAFLGAVAAPGVDSFDDLELDLYDSPLDRTAGAYGYQAAATGGLYGAGGGADAWLSTNLRLSPIVFQNFTGGVSGFGGNFFASDVGGQYVAGGNLVLTAADGSSLNYALSNATQASFIGFVSDAALTSVTLGTDGGLYWPTANNVVLAAAVPEPATWGMLLAGLGMAGAAARRRRR